MKIFPITIFFLLNFLIIGVSGDKCFEKFKLFLESSCQGLKYNFTNGCEFINNKCQIKPNCNAAGNNRQMCNSIKLTDNSKKCEIQSDLCTEITKTCTEYEKGKNNCGDLSSGESNKRCVLDKNGICKAHYDSCNDADQQTCEGNIPNDSSKKCIWKDNTCQEVYKTCNEVDFNPHNCLDFPTSDDEKFNCVASIKGCKEQYKNCDLYNNNVNSNDKNKEDCESIIFFGTREKCIYDDENKICTQVNKECKDMLKGSCSDFTPSDSNKRCTLIGDKCEEIFNTCDLYDKFGGKKNKEYCEKILPYYDNRNELDNHSKCIFSSNSKCEKKTKSCSEITGDTVCIDHVLDDENKKCIYIYKTHECKEVYKSCSNYKIKNREGCLGIVLYKENGYTINYNQICKYENDACSIKDLVQCSDYESRLDKEYCTNIHIGENINCAIKDNQCIEHFNSCPENANKETCNSKPLISDTEKCVYNENEGCIKIKKECSEYKGKSSDKCEHLDTKDANKKCFMENGECVAKYIYCDKYEGNDKATCESIIPFDSKGTISKSNKCVIEGNKCVMKNKECSEAKTYKECFEIKPSDTNKNCIYLNGECKEQYKDCASYNSNGKESIEKDKCESILIMDDLWGFSKICVFTQGNTNVPNKCEEREKICTDFKVQNLQSMCYYTTELTSVENKCAYFNSNCQEIKKTCSDLYDETSATKEICEAAPTSDSSRKTCVLKEDESGCEEINKQNTNNSKFLVGDKKMINNLLLFIFILFV